MSDVMLYGGGYAPARRDSRQAARAISRMGSQVQVRQAAIDNETDATISKAESGTSVTAHGMMGVAKIGQLQQQLEMHVPGASWRLAMLADDHAYGTAEIAMDHRRRLRRL
jgi:hypothetical protein